MPQSWSDSLERLGGCIPGVLVLERFQSEDVVIRLTERPRGRRLGEERAGGLDAHR